MCRVKKKKEQPTKFNQRILWELKRNETKINEIYKQKEKFFFICLVLCWKRKKKQNEKRNEKDKNKYFVLFLPCLRYFCFICNTYNISSMNREQKNLYVYLCISRLSLVMLPSTVADDHLKPQSTNILAFH